MKNIELTNAMEVIKAHLEALKEANAKIYNEEVAGNYEEARDNMRLMDKILSDIEYYDDLLTNTVETNDYVARF